MNTRPHIFSLATALFIGAGTAGAQGITLDFEALNEGQLPGQDNWEVRVGTLSGTNLSVVSNLNSKVIAAVSASGGTVIRDNDANFSFPRFYDSETNATMFADIRVSDIAGAQNVILSVANNTNGQVSAETRLEAISPAFGMIHVTTNSPLFPLSFIIRGAAEGTVNTQPVGALAGNGDWVTLRFTMNFKTGKGSLAYKNLTRGQTDFTLLQSLTDIDLEMERLGTNAPSTWNAAAARIIADTSLPPDQSFRFDNFIPHLTPVLIPTVSDITPPRYLTIGADQLEIGATYRVESRPIGSTDPWVLEAEFVATSGTMDVYTTITPDVYASREFRLIGGP